MKSPAAPRSVRASKRRPTDESLRQFLSRRKAGPPASGPSLGEIRTEWRGAIEALMTQLQSWLRPLEERGLVATEPRQIPRIEPQLGTYTATELTVHFVGHPSVRIHPVARVIVGASGRVDMSCGPRYLMLIRAQGGRWTIESPEEGGTSARLGRVPFEQALRRLIAPAP
jgi:hypothetical protein